MQKVKNIDAKSFSTICNLLEIDEGMTDILRDALVERALHFLALIPDDKLDKKGFVYSVSKTPIHAAIKSGSLVLMEAMHQRVLTNTEIKRDHIDIVDLRKFEEPERALKAWMGCAAETQVKNRFFEIALNAAQSRDIKTLELLEHSASTDFALTDGLIYNAQTEISKLAKEPRTAFLKVLERAVQKEDAASYFFEQAIKKKVSALAYLPLRFAPHFSHIFVEKNATVRQKEGTQDPGLSFLIECASSAHGLLQLQGEDFDAEILFDGETGSFTKNLEQAANLDDFRTAKRKAKLERQRKRGRL